MQGEHRPFLVKKRIFNGTTLYGIGGEVGGEKVRVNNDQALGMMLNGVDFIVDVNHEDRPAKLTIVHKTTSTGGIYFFRTVGDKNRKNNFNNVPKISVNSCRKYKMLK
jgi:hypothetical protein